MKRFVYGNLVDDVEQAGISERPASANTSNWQPTASFSIGAIFRGTRVRHNVACPFITRGDPCPYINDDTVCPFRPYAYCPFIINGDPCPYIDDDDDTACSSRHDAVCPFITHGDSCPYLDDYIIRRSTELAIASTSTEPAIASTSTEPAIASTSTEPAIASTSTEPAIASTSTEPAIIFSEQPGVLKLKRLYRDFPRLSLPAYVDFGNLLSIAQRYVEFRPIIRLVLRLNRALPVLSRSEQRKVVSTVVKIEELLNELVPFTDKPYDPKEIDELFCRLGCRLDYVCSILQKTMVQRYSLFLVFGFDVFPSENRRDLVFREKDEEVDENFLRRIGKAQTYLRTRLDTKYLGEISRDHPEFGPSIKTALSVNSAMKYLTYEGQVKVFKTLYEFQETIKELILFKTYHYVYYFEMYVPRLISKAAKCFDELLENLRKQVEPPRKVDTYCEPCQAVTRFVKNVNVKPEHLKKKPVNPNEVLKGVVAYANFGINQERVRNLESLIHHLAAKKGAFMHVLLYQSRIDWAEIARQYKEYLNKARQDIAQLGIWKNHIFWRLVEAEEVMVEARDFCDRFRATGFVTGNETLSESIALGGELELLASEAEEYLTNLQELIGQFLKDWQNCLTANLRIRRSRYVFLTKTQWEAFDFPY